MGENDRSYIDSSLIAVLADHLHAAGVDAYSCPKNVSGEHWDAYRRKIAERLLRRGLKVKKV